MTVEGPPATVTTRRRPVHQRRVQPGRRNAPPRAGTAAGHDHLGGPGRRPRRRPEPPHVEQATRRQSPAGRRNNASTSPLTSHVVSGAGSRPPLPGPPGPAGHCHGRHVGPADHRGDLLEGHSNMSGSRTRAVRRDSVRDDQQLPSDQSARTPPPPRSPLALITIGEVGPRAPAPVPRDRTFGDSATIVVAPAGVLDPAVRPA